MGKQNIIPLNIETEFRLEELFFSTTDEKGIIESGNTVFARVSGYPYAELIGEPHNLVRHPDMPRAVFKLLWEAIQAGKPIVAYVKNLASNGYYYWVAALVTPLPTGYLSVRFKPSADMLATVQDVYQQARAIEIESPAAGSARQSAMEKSQAFILSKLSELGFRDYEDFMTTALRQELQSRDRILHEKRLKTFPDEVRAPNDGLPASLGRIFAEGTTIYGHVLQLFNQIDEFIALGDTLKQKSEFVLELTDSFQMVSMNAAVEAAKLRGHGNSLGVIASHLGETSQDIARQAKLMRERIDLLTPQLARVSFGLASARLQMEMLMEFCHEFIELSKKSETLLNAKYIASAPKMIRSLETAFRFTFETVVADLDGVDLPLRRLSESSDDLRRTILTLLFSQLIGNVESTPLGEKSNFRVIFDQIKEQIDSAKIELTTLISAVARISERLSLLPEITEKCDRGLAVIAAINADLDVTPSVLV
ncbi:MAG: PAS domain-containing protein [Pirellulales bacterium]